MGKTAYEKIVQAHTKKVLDDGRKVLSLDRVWCHEITTPNAILDAQIRDCDVVFNPNRIKAMIDHVNPAKDTASAIQGQIMRDWCEKHDIEFFDVGRNGICHALIPELGLILPGEIGVMGDSHTCTHGAFCSFSAGVGTSDLGNAIRTGLWICKPQKVIRVNFEGKLPDNVFAKDLILHFIHKISVKGAVNAVLEFGGSVISNMSMEARMTITNMAKEAGATTGMMMVDETTIKYLCPIISIGTFKTGNLDTFPFDLMKWNSDADCKYDEEINIPVDALEPVITYDYLPENVVKVKELAGKKVNQVYIGSCTNGRIEDLRIAAHIFLKTGKKVAKNVRCIVVPATHNTWMQANKEGLLNVFMKAGCAVSYPTCGACLGMSNGVIAPGEICVSTTNRNFFGRMGSKGMVHLTSPATAAITAVEGVIAVPSVGLLDDYTRFKSTERVKPTNWRNVPVKKIDYIELAEKQSGESIDFSGQVFHLDQKNIDTDQIIPAKYLTETDMAVFGEHCLEEVLTSKQDRDEINSCQILVAGENFGCGSSREHAVWALAGVGIKCVIAPSFDRIFYDNMFSKGLLCIEASQEEINKLIENVNDLDIEYSGIGIDWENGKVSYGKSGSVIFEFHISDYQKSLIRNSGSMGGMLALAAEIYNQKQEE